MTSRANGILPPVSPVRSGVKTPSRARKLLVLALLPCLGLAACAGTVIDQEKVQDTTQQSLERTLHEKIKGVDCPSGVSVTPGSTFTCDVIFPDGKQMTATLKIRDKEADVSIVGLKANK